MPLDDTILWFAGLRTWNRRSVPAVIERDGRVVIVIPTQFNGGLIDAEPGSA